MEPAERLEARIHHILPLADAFLRILNQKKAVLPQNPPLEKRSSYCLNQEAFLRVFLTDGYVPMTNNAAERSIRPFTVGRNNWFQIDTVSGAKASAIAYSIAETAKANQLNPMNIPLPLGRASKTWRIRRAVLCRRAAPVVRDIAENAATRKRKLIKFIYICRP